MWDGQPRLCRVSLYAGGTHADLALPADVPVAELLPVVVDLLAAHDGARHRVRPGARYRLARPGHAALEGAKTLAQQEVRNGSTVMLSWRGEDAPGPCFDDPADQVVAAVNAAGRAWTAPASQRAAGAASVAMAAAAGCIAVPGGPGTPNVLLAGAAATVVAVLARLLGERGAMLTGLGCLALLVTAVALAALLTASRPVSVCALTAAAAVGLLHSAARLATALSGLAGAMAVPAAAAVDDLDDRTVRAYRLLTGLVGAFSAAAALGALGAAVGVHAAGGPRFGGVALAAVTAVALLLRTRWHADRFQITALLIGAGTAAAVALLAAAAELPQHATWLGLATAAAAVGLLQSATRPGWWGLGRRAAELLEYPVLVALVPLACWITGCYGAIRGLSLR